MAIYIAITKIFEDIDKYIYELSNGLGNSYCFAVITVDQKKIEFYKELTLENLLYTYKIFNEYEKNTNEPFPINTKDAIIWGRSLTKLIPAIEQGIFPKYLDKCS